MNTPETAFLEVYVKASLQEVIRRDPKGLYKKALKGEIDDFTGITDPYEPPENPQLVLDTESNTIEHNVSHLYNLVKTIIK
ncbi:adenylyl-sulfate kinase [Aeropyrum pernix]|uniref:adenylyl-sulfate kinase n=1 Tax=Aeropyrum pernix TaxID=56636 RepID=UPI0024374073|nr:adenylyl-sulfate kinase [Aeropyrum pernix]